MIDTGLREGEGASGPHWSGGRMEQNLVPQVFVSDFFIYRGFTTGAMLTQVSGGAPGDRWGECLSVVQSLMHVAEVMAAN